MSTKTHFIQIILLISLLPFVLGFEECPTNETFQGAVEQKIIASGSKGGPINIHLAFLPIVDEVQDENSTNITSSINEFIPLFLDGWGETFNKNDVRFTFYDSDNRATSVHMPLMVINTPKENAIIHAQKVISILYSSEAQKNSIQTIILNYMIPLDIDILITGQYIKSTDTDKEVKLKLAALFKSNQKVILKQLNFQIDNLLCDQKEILHEKKICESISEEISGAIFEFFINIDKNEQKKSTDIKSRVTYKELEIEKTVKQMDKTINQMIDQKFKPSTGNSQVYITHLTFVDADTKSIMAQTEVAELINKAVVDGMNLAKNANPQLAINEPGHSIENSDVNANKLINIIWDVNLAKGDKIHKIISGMMEPNQIDVIVTGQYLEKEDNTINVRPFVVFKSEKNISSKNHIFDKGQFICSDPNNSSTKVLCPSVHEKIVFSVKELLESL